MNEKNSSCCVCNSSKVPNNCEVCGQPVCKQCTQTLNKKDFFLKKSIPKVLSHRFYCNPCFQSNVENELQNYYLLLEKAKNVYMIFSAERRPIHLIKKSSTSIEVNDNHDKEECFLRLGYLAAEKSFNAIIDVTIESKKLRHGEKYRSTLWKGTGFPAQLDTEVMRENEKYELYKR